MLALRFVRPAVPLYRQAAAQLFRKEEFQLDNQDFQASCPQTAARFGCRNAQAVPGSGKCRAWTFQAGFGGKLIFFDFSRIKREQKVNFMLQ